MKITKRVVYLPASNDGCALWRMYMPHLRYPGSNYRQCHPTQPMHMALVDGFQIAVVQRLTSTANYKALEMLKRQHIKVVYDLDDNIWNVPKYNPAYDLFRNPSTLHGAEKCAKMADCITTSTSWLATVVKRRLGNSVRVETVENAVDMDLFYRARKPVQRPYVIIGWAGTPTHHIDLTYAMNALATVLREREDVHAHFMGGAEAPDQIKDLIKKNKIATDRVVLHPWVNPSEYPAWISNLNWDMALAPLAVENEFNRSKSNCKILEAAALGIPCLASPAAEYAKFCEGGPVLENMLCNKTEDWVKKINAFVDSAELRDQTVQAMKARTLERYEIHGRIEQLNQIYESL